MTNNNRRCPLCRSDKNKNLFVQKFANQLNHRIVTCQKCGFVFVVNIPNQSTYTSYYQNSSKYEDTRDFTIHEKSCQIIDDFLVSRENRRIKILDIGCSTGHLLFLLKNKGYRNLSGIDPSPKCKEIALNKYQINIEPADLFYFAPKQKYDFIILSSVLEHLREVQKAVNHITSLLSQNGYLFIIVPDAGNFYKNFDEPFGEFSTEHINFFSTDYLFRLLSHFDCRQIQSNNQIVFSIWQKTGLLSKSLEEYIRLSKIKLGSVKIIINRAPPKLLVWGAGSLTRRLLTTTLLSEKVYKYIDRDQSLIGKKLAGIEILSPSEISKYPEPILIASFRFNEEIQQYIRAKKLKNRVITFL